jgi:hypothetical protein
MNIMDRSVERKTSKGEPIRSRWRAAFTILRAHLVISAEHRFSQVSHRPTHTRRHSLPS